MDTGTIPRLICISYELALLADFVLIKTGKRQEIPITLELDAGHLGVGGITNSAKVQNLLESRAINLIENAAIDQISPDQITLGDRQEIPFNYAMILPSSRFGR